MNLSILFYKQPKTLGRKSVPFLLAAAMIAGLLWTPSAASAQSENSCAQTVVVQSGDSLSAIAARTLGSPLAYLQIVAATNVQAATDSRYARITNPGLISVGQQVCIPEGEFAPTPGTAASGTSASEPVATGPVATPIPTPEEPVREEIVPEEHPLSIAYMRAQSYPGSELVTAQALAPRNGYSQSVVSYQSDGLAIRALLTIPSGPVPEGGWPAIVFNHGYIPPEVYRTTERYVAYVDFFARNGYVVIKPDYRGHGFSEGEANGGHTNPDYTIDVLNAYRSVQNHPAVDGDRVGLWGHSMGGAITLRAMVVDPSIKAGVIWAGVVVSYQDLYGSPALQTVRVPGYLRNRQDDFFARYGSPDENPEFWTAVSPNQFVTDLSGPIELHHATGDASVPYQYSRVLEDQILAAGGSVNYFEYQGDNHNISVNFGAAMVRSLAFFDQHVKNAP